MGDEDSVVRAARVSFAHDNELHPPERDAKLIQYLARNKHYSPFEHTSVTFHIAAPIFVVRQWHRHRIFSYNEVSRRYTSENLQIYYPYEWRKQATKNRQASEGKAKHQHLINIIYGIAVWTCLFVYWLLLKLGVAREQARMILPQSLYTRMYVTGNLRAYADFYKLRAAPDAQHEIRVYALAMGEALEDIYPVAWPALINDSEPIQLTP